MRGPAGSVSVVFPTYRRETILLNTLKPMFSLVRPGDEIIVVDQTAVHEPETEDTLRTWHEKGRIRWIRLAVPSIPRAMNIGLTEAGCPAVLFLDDDVVPGESLIAAHAQALSEDDSRLVAGRVVQPWDNPDAAASVGTEFRFSSDTAREVTEFMGGNFSLMRDHAIELGGFDENFIGVAYRFERDFADRWLDAGRKIWFYPAASIQHLKAVEGGTRSYGSHLSSLSPAHSVGAYYYLLRSPRVKRRGLRLALRLIRSIRTKHHLRRPWWIVATLVAELRGLALAIRLRARGPGRLMNSAGQK